MKKIINTSEHYTDDILCGVYAAHPDMAKYMEDDPRCCCTAKKKRGKVAIITGKDTGHLPLFFGYMGENPLNSCGAGGMFQSSSSGQTYNMAKEVEAGAGALFLYGDYTRDIMNFSTAAEMLGMDDIRTANVVGADDVFSNKDAQVRRGIAGVFFMYKYTGARAARMGMLEEMLTTAEKAKENTRTTGLTPTPYVIPEIGHSSFALTEGEVVFGMGVHGEPDVWNGPVKTADELAKESAGEIPTDAPLNPGEGVCALINGLGVTSQEELYILSGSVYRLLEEKGIRAYRTFVGEYATNMEMAEASISICRMADQEMKQRTDAPVHTPFYAQV